MSETKAEKIALVFVSVLIGVVNLPFEGFVISKAWLWFAVPLGAPAITWFHGSALTVVFALVAFRWEDRSKETGERFLTRSVSAFMVTLSTLGIVAILHWLAQS